MPVLLLVLVFCWLCQYYGSRSFQDSATGTTKIKSIQQSFTQSFIGWMNEQLVLLLLLVLAQSKRKLYL